jgi:hypothetical protein
LTFCYGVDSNPVSVFFKEKPTLSIRSMESMLSIRSKRLHIAIC